MSYLDPPTYKSRNTVVDVNTVVVVVFRSCESLIGFSFEEPQTFKMDVDYKKGPDESLKDERFPLNRGG